MKLDASSVAQGKGNTGALAVPCSISLHEKRPPGFSTRATSRASPSLSAMFIVTANDQTLVEGAVLERQEERIALSNLNPVCKTAACG